VLLWRLSIIREVLLSGFQLELYVDDEKSFVYWELSHVAHEHLATLKSLEPVIPKGELVYRPMGSGLTVDSIGRFQGLWRTYLRTLIS
jgi:N-alpha-acetyltransferase 35, NatC auxiliary subunit